MKKALAYLVLALSVQLLTSMTALAQRPRAIQDPSVPPASGENLVPTEAMSPEEMPLPPSGGRSTRPATPQATAPAPVADYREAAPAMPPPGAMMANGPLDANPWDPNTVGPCCTQCGGGCRVPQDWYTEQGARFLARSRPRDIGVTYEFENELGYSGAEQLNSRSASPDISAMWYMTIGHYFAHDASDRDHFIEFTFYGLNNWRDEASFAGQRIGDGNGGTHGDLYSGFSVYRLLGNTGLSVPVQTGVYIDGFDRADYQSTYYSSFLNNFELNGRITPRGRPDRLVLYPNGKWQRECQPGMQMSYLYGVRFLQLNETFRYHSEATISPADEASQVYTGDYDIVTHNNLLGIQVGAEMMFRQCRWAWGIRSKVGPYINFADQESDITSGPALAPTWYRRLAEGKHEAALIGEVGFEATYKFTPNFMGRAAYDFMWVSGVALAPEQLQFNSEPVNKLNNNGLAFFQGLSLGFEWLW